MSQGKTLLGIAILVWMACGSGCAQEPNPLLGVWYDASNSDNAIEFTQGGTVVVTQQGATTKATYKLLSPGQVELTFPAFATPLVYNFSVDQDRFVWSQANQPQINSRTYQRSKPRPDKANLVEASNAAIDESLSLATALRVVVAEYYLENGTLPQTMEDAAVVRAPEGQYSSVVVEQGNLVVRFHGDSKAVETLKGTQLVLTPITTSNGDFVWVCGYKNPVQGLKEMVERLPTTVSEAFLPSACRK